MKTLKYVATLLGLLLMIALCGCYYTSGVGMGESDCTYKNAESYLVGEGKKEGDKVVFGDSALQVEVSTMSGNVTIEK